MSPLFLTHIVENNWPLVDAKEFERFTIFNIIVERLYIDIFEMTFIFTAYPVNWFMNPYLVNNINVNALTSIDIH